MSTISRCLLQLLLLTFLQNVFSETKVCPEGHTLVNGFCVQQTSSCPANYVLSNGVCYLASLPPNLPNPPPSAQPQTAAPPIAPCATPQQATACITLCSTQVQSLPFINPCSNQLAAWTTPCGNQQQAPPFGSQPQILPGYLPCNNQQQASVPPCAGPSSPGTNQPYLPPYSTAPNTPVVPPIIPCVQPPAVVTPIYPETQFPTLPSITESPTITNSTEATPNPNAPAPIISSTTTPTPDAPAPITSNTTTTTTTTPNPNAPAPNISSTSTLRPDGPGPIISSTTTRRPDDSAPIISNTTTTTTTTPNPSAPAPIIASTTTTPKPDTAVPNIPDTTTTSTTTPNPIAPAPIISSTTTPRPDAPSPIIASTTTPKPDASAPIISNTTTTTTTTLNPNALAPFITTTTSPTTITPTPPPPRSESLTRCPPGTILLHGVCRLIYCGKGIYKDGRCVQTECPAGTTWNGLKCAAPEPQNLSFTSNNTVVNHINHITEIARAPKATVENKVESVPKKCCIVMSPRLCQPGGENERWKCYSRRYKRCGDICTAPVVYLAPSEPRVTPQYVVMPPEMGLSYCRHEQNCPESQDYHDCSGCSIGIAQSCSTYCYNYNCGSRRCQFHDQQHYCSMYPGESGCQEADGCIDDWCSGSDY